MEFEQHDGGDDQRHGVGDGSGHGEYDDTGEFGVDGRIDESDGDAADAGVAGGDAGECVDSEEHDGAVHGDGDVQ